MFNPRSSTGAQRQAYVGSAAGDHALMLKSMTATERLSDLYEIHLELYANDAEITPQTMLGKNLTVGWKWDPEGEARHWSGICRSFGLVGGEHTLSVYRAVVVPPLWLLTQRVNSRIFDDNMSVADIVSTILGEHGLSAETLEGMTETLEYCVQWEETDYAFICRLMERYGCYYYHAHDNGAVALHIVQAGHAHPQMPWHNRIPVRDPLRAFPSIEWFDEFGERGQIRPDTATNQDYNFTTPRASLEGTNTVAPEYTLHQLEHYRYQTGQADASGGNNFAEYAAQGFQADWKTYVCAGNARSIGPGYWFELDTDQGLSWMPDTQLLCIESVSALAQTGFVPGDGDGGTTFTCSVVSAPKTVQWRPKQTTPWPRIHGVQSATVDNENGEELDVDEHGRIRVSFHWQREGKRSMRARVAQVWAGANWGAGVWPRNGHEVLVEYLNGDPDRPVVTGSLFNASAPPPHDPSSSASIMAIKSRTIGGGGFNSLEFQDEAGEEYVFMHAQKDVHYRTTNDRVELTGNNAHEKVVGNSFLAVDGNRHATIAGDDVRNVSGADNVSVQGARMVTVSGALTELASGNMTYASDGNVVISAGQKITLTAGGAFITLSSSGVDIQGTMVKINSGGMAGMPGQDRAATAEAPEEPLEGEPGTEPEATRQRDWAAAQANIDSNPAAAALAAASESGAPFCEVCERARQEREAAEAAAMGGEEDEEEGMQMSSDEEEEEEMQLSGGGGDGSEDPFG